jgi:hypothetical protein
MVNKSCEPIIIIKGDRKVIINKASCERGFNRFNKNSADNI